MFTFLRNKLKNLFNTHLDESLFDKIEQLLFESDFGSELTEIIVENLKKRASGLKTESDLLKELGLIFKEILYSKESFPLRQHPDVYLITGTNGSGKTTTVAKLAHYFIKENRRVLIVAADTFRAAALEQLEIWTKKIGCHLIKGHPGADPASVACDGIKAALARGFDTVLIDTSGRLHSNYDLMQELRKIVKVCDKSLQGVPFNHLLAIDATLGNNTVEQVNTFHRIHPVTGLILTKTDGTAKGGTIFNIYRNFNIPTLYLGFGEDIDDLKPFDSETFIKRMISL